MNNSMKKCLTKEDFEKISNLVTDDFAGYVYILELGAECVKIGRTKNLYRRIREHMKNFDRHIVSICHTPLCTNYCELEMQMHNHFLPHRIESEIYCVSYKNAVEKLSELDTETNYKKVIQTQSKKLKCTINSLRSTSEQLKYLKLQYQLHKCQNKLKRLNE